MIEIRTLNSTYQVDEGQKLVRRSEPNPDAGHRLADGEWHPYISYQPWGDTFVFLLTHGKATLLSRVVSMSEMTA